MFRRKFEDVEFEEFLPYMLQPSVDQQNRNPNPKIWPVQSKMVNHKLTEDRRSSHPFKVDKPSAGVTFALAYIAMRECFLHNRRVLIIENYTTERSEILFIIRTILVNLGLFNFDYIQQPNRIIKFHGGSGMIATYKSTEMDKINQLRASSVLLSETKSDRVIRIGLILWDDYRCASGANNCYHEIGAETHINIIASTWDCPVITVDTSKKDAY